MYSPRHRFTVFIAIRSMVLFLALSTICCGVKPTHSFLFE